jgi:hypothetical protein
MHIRVTFLFLRLHPYGPPTSGKAIDTSHYYLLTQAHYIGRQK